MRKLLKLTTVSVLLKSPSAPVQASIVILHSSVNHGSPIPMELIEDLGMHLLATPTKDTANLLKGSEKGSLTIDPNPPFDMNIFKWKGRLISSV